MARVSALASGLPSPVYDFTDRPLILAVGAGTTPCAPPSCRRRRRRVTRRSTTLSVVEDAASNCYFPRRAPPHPGLLLHRDITVHVGGHPGTTGDHSELLARVGFRQTRGFGPPGPSPHRGAGANEAQAKPSHALPERASTLPPWVDARSLNPKAASAIVVSCRTKTARDESPPPDQGSRR
jgi:hypothetical protein